MAKLIVNPTSSARREIALAAHARLHRPRSVERRGAARRHGLAPPRGDRVPRQPVLPARLQLLERLAGQRRPRERAQPARRRPGGHRHRAPALPRRPRARGAPGQGRAAPVRAAPAVPRLPGRLPQGRPVLPPVRRAAGASAPPQGGLHLLRHGGAPARAVLQRLRPASLAATSARLPRHARVRSTPRCTGAAPGPPPPPAARLPVDACARRSPSEVADRRCPTATGARTRSRAVRARPAPLGARLPGGALRRGLLVLRGAGAGADAGLLYWRSRELPSDVPYLADPALARPGAARARPRRAATTSAFVGRAGRDAGQAPLRPRGRGRGRQPAARPLPRVPASARLRALGLPVRRRVPA